MLGGSYSGDNCRRWELSGGNCPGGDYLGVIIINIIYRRK